MSDTKKAKSRLLGRLVARELSEDEVNSVAGAGAIALTSTYKYTTIGGTKEIDSADNGDQIP